MEMGIFRKFIYVGVNKRRIVIIFLVIMLTMPLMFTSAVSATDMCDTNPSACQCSQATCNKACLIEELGLYTWQDAVGYGMEIGICVNDCTMCVASEGADAEACSSCLQCVIENTATPASCLGACSGDPCSYGYECTPCSPWLPYTYRCSDHTREAKFCQCDGQGWYWSELACPSGKSCCISNGGVVCVDLQTDPNNCGSCGNICPPENPICEEGECVPEASTLILLATGLLFMAGYVKLKRRKTK